MLANTWLKRTPSRTRASRSPRARTWLWPLAAIVFLYFTIVGFSTHHKSNLVASELVHKHIDHSVGTGGRWYIPTSWLEEVQSSRNHTLISKIHPQTVVEAAQLALELSLLTSSFATHTHIPLIAHQTWRSLKSDEWPETVQESVDGWLAAATSQNPHRQQMAYLLWDDDGINQLMQNYEPYLWDLFQNLPYPVEKADTFRVAVLRWFGGFYADVDVHLLQHPDNWVHASDLDRWTDQVTGESYSPNASPYYEAASPNAHGASRYQVPITCPSPYQELMTRGSPRMQGVDDPVGAIFGIECDTAEDTDDYWGWGYSHPVQLSNWAMASAPLHPATSAYLTQLTYNIRANITSLSSIDPLDLTGPPALTTAIKAHVASIEDSNFRWSAVSGLHDPEGGRGKVVAGDVLVLPITGFSPGRGWPHKMGSMPKTHENARLAHMAQGSWRKTSLKVETGKLCRSMFRHCKEWKKIP